MFQNGHALENATCLKGAGDTQGRDFMGRKLCKGRTVKIHSPIVDGLKPAHAQDYQENRTDHRPANAPHAADDEHGQDDKRFFQPERIGTHESSVMGEECAGDPRKKCRDHKRQHFGRENRDGHGLRRQLVFPDGDKGASHPGGHDAGNEKDDDNHENQY